MSCFGGRMHEYDRVSLDRFDGNNLQSTVYFLSHLHEDHTVGLGNAAFFKRLKTGLDVFLYCSAVTKVLIEASVKYKHLLPYIKTLDINVPTTVSMPDPWFDVVETVCVTFLPAFHCPGSIMCLFEGKEGNVLYTGDFRWEHFQIEQMEHLRNKSGVKHLKSVYIDTTFFMEDTLFIPSRESCIEAVVRLAQEWIQQGPEYQVYVNLRAQYGHEPLLLGIAVRMNQKVHVPARKLSAYEQIHEFKGHFTSDAQDTQLHACGSEVQGTGDNGQQVFCRHSHLKDKVLVLLPTTMYFTQFQHLTLDKIIRRVGSSFYRACYSFHSSYTEIQNLLNYLKPEKAYPNVKPPADASLAETQHRLNVMLLPLKSSLPSEDSFKELGALKLCRKSAVKRKDKESLSDSESLDFGSPCKKSRRSVTPPPNSKYHGSQRDTNKTPQKNGAQGDTHVSSGTKVNLPDPGATGDVQVTPCKSEVSDVQSSYAGSLHSGSEMDLTQSSQENGLSQRSDVATLPGSVNINWIGSLLDAVNYNCSQEEAGTQSCCVCLPDDVEQTDKGYTDANEIQAIEEDGEATGRTQEELVNQDSTSATSTNQMCEIKKTKDSSSTVTENHSLGTGAIDTDENLSSSQELLLKDSKNNENEQSVTGSFQRKRKFEEDKVIDSDFSESNKKEKTTSELLVAETEVSQSEKKVEITREHQTKVHSENNKTSEGKSAIMSSKADGDKREPIGSIEKVEVAADAGKTDSSKKLGENTDTNSSSDGKDLKQDQPEKTKAKVDGNVVENGSLDLFDNSLDDSVVLIMDESNDGGKNKGENLTGADKVDKSDGVGPDLGVAGSSQNDGGSEKQAKKERRVVVVKKSESSKLEDQEGSGSIKDEPGKGEGNSKDVIVIDDEGWDDESITSSSSDDEDADESYDEDSDIVELDNGDCVIENGRRKVAPRKKLSKDKMRRKVVEMMYDTSDEDSDSDDTLPPPSQNFRMSFLNNPDEVVCVSSDSGSAGVKPQPVQQTGNSSNSNVNQGATNAMRMEYFKLDRVAMQRTIDKLTESVMKQYQQSFSVQMVPGPSWADDAGFVVTSSEIQQTTVQSLVTATQGPPGGLTVPALPAPPGGDTPTIRPGGVIDLTQSEEEEQFSDVI